METILGAFITIVARVGIMVVTSSESVALLAGVANGKHGGGEEAGGVEGGRVAVLVGGEAGAVNGDDEGARAEWGADEDGGGAFDDLLEVGPGLAGGGFYEVGYGRGVAVWFPGGFGFHGVCSLGLAWS
jgi:hypothetical protein